MVEYKVEMLLGQKVVIEFINASTLIGVLIAVTPDQYVVNTGKKIPEFIERVNVKLVRPFEERGGNSG